MPRQSQNINRVRDISNVATMVALVCTLSGNMPEARQADAVRADIRNALTTIPPFKTEDVLTPPLSVSPPTEDGEKIIRLKLGDKEIEVVTYKQRSGLRYISLHDNENTAVEAVRSLLKVSGGELTELRNEGKRRIAFTLEGRTYDFDPNRMFTDEGIKATLRPFYKNEKAADSVRFFAAGLLNHLHLDHPDGGAVVGLHNNRDEGHPMYGATEDYSIYSYHPGKRGAKESLQVFFSPFQDPDDFFLVTDQPLFNRLKEAGFNVVLEPAEAGMDDGTLSVYCRQHHIPYITIEAEHGHLIQQIEMIRTLNETIR